MVNMTLNKKTFPLICLVVDLPLLHVREANISHLGKRNVIFKKCQTVGDILVPWRIGQKVKQTHNNRLNNHISFARFSDVSRTRSARSAIHALIFLGISVTFIFHICFFCVFFSDCTMATHHLSPPFGNIFWELFPSILSNLRKLTCCQQKQRLTDEPPIYGLLHPEMQQKLLPFCDLFSW